MGTFLNSVFHSYYVLLNFIIIFVCSCVFLSFDDGEIRIIGLLKAACDVSVTGMPCVKTQQHGSHSYYCPSSSIWSVQVSKLTGN